MGLAVERRTDTWVRQVAGSALFAGFEESEIVQVTDCLGAQRVRFGSGETLVAGNSRTSVVGLVLDGSVFASTHDANGTRHLVSAMTAGEVFAEDMLTHDLQHTEHSVTGARPGEALLLGMEKIVHSTGPLCHLRSRVVENLFRVMSAKNRMLQAKLRIVSRKSLRDRVVLFLAEQQRAHGSADFTVVFSRAELADYLGVDRAALSRELMRMKGQGLIDFHRSTFTVMPGLADHWSTP
ncbi:Crp/Fnr family transcriptional regulator [Tomitella biformata]|uniref:Crp/Fnr family transcriptional regulator n=1 Tax=Tomitella biformata TaxID=630403 RepID=UPI0004B1FCD3|nr:Crp/Fnr family transcriptional regulator [Tomitella biformata]